MKRKIRHNRINYTRGYDFEIIKLVLCDNVWWYLNDSLE